MSASSAGTAVSMSSVISAPSSCMTPDSAPSSTRSSKGSCLSMLALQRTHTSFQHCQRKMRMHIRVIHC